MKLKLNDRNVRAKKPPQKGQDEYWDTEAKGLALRVSYAGTKSWTVMTRLRGKQRRYKLGQYPELSLAAARSKARDYKVSAQAGLDPEEAQKRAREDAARRQRDNFAAVADLYIEKHLPKLSRGHEVAQTIRRELIPYWGSSPIGDIDHRDVEAVIDAKAALHPTAANRLLALVKKLFNWCIEKRIIEDSPAAHIKPPAEEVERERTLDEDEIRGVWVAAGGLGPFGVLVRLLLLTGQRKSEVAEMRWSEVNIEAHIWTISGVRTKSGKGHVIPLSGFALEILNAIPPSGDYVITPNGHGPIRSFGKPKARLDTASGVANWRMHDLRRTAATNWASMGEDLIVISKLLNHAESGVTKVYVRMSRDKEKRVALERWGEELRRIVEGRKAEKVVPLRGGSQAPVSA